MSKLSEKFNTKFAEFKTHDKKTTVKAVTRFVVRSSVSGVIVTAVHNYVPTATKAQKAQLYVGAWALGGVAADAASNWAADKVIDYIEIVEAVVEDAKESEKTQETWNKATHN